MESLDLVKNLDLLLGIILDNTEVPWLISLFFKIKVKYLPYIPTKVWLVLYVPV